MCFMCKNSIFVFYCCRILIFYVHNTRIQFLCVFFHAQLTANYILMHLQAVVSATLLVPCCSVCHTVSGQISDDDDDDDENAMKTDILSFTKNQAMDVFS